MAGALRRAASLLPRLHQAAGAELAPAAAALNRAPLFGSWAATADDKPSSSFSRGEAAIGAAAECPGRRRGLGAPQRAGRPPRTLNPTRPGPAAPWERLGNAPWRLAGALIGGQARLGDCAARRPGRRRSTLPAAAVALALVAPAGYSTTTELAAAAAAGLSPTTYAMKNPTPTIT